MSDVLALVGELPGIANLINSTSILILLMAGFAIVISIFTRHLYVVLLVTILSGLLIMIATGLMQVPQDDVLLYVSLLSLAVLILLVHGFQLRATQCLTAKMLDKVEHLDQRVDEFLNALERRAELVDRKVESASQTATAHTAAPPTPPEIRRADA
jgi:hypothetical protein